MSAEMPKTLLRSAIEWHVRLRDGDDISWEAFASWLAEDPRHAAACDEVEALERTIEPLLAELKQADPANDVSEIVPERRRFGGWAIGAVAASVAAVLVFGAPFGSQRYEIATSAGERQEVLIDADTRVALNGATKVVLDRANPRFAALVYGQAMFEVRHDDAHPFVVDVGEERIVDLGTVFDVVRDGGETRVAVAEGRISYQGPGGSAALAAGQSLRAPREGAPVVSDISPAAVGAWRQRRLLYSVAPLAQVAQDLARTLGVPIRVAPAIADRPVSGNLTVTGTSVEEMRRIGIALDVRFVRRQGVWVMEPAIDERY